MSFANKKTVKINRKNILAGTGMNDIIKKKHIWKLNIYEVTGPFQN